MMFRAVDVYIVFLHDMEYQFYGIFFRGFQAFLFD